MKNNTDIKDNQIMLLKEELECIHMYLDDKEIAREDEQNKTYSIVGRIKQLEKNYTKESSAVETHYLSEIEGLKLDNSETHNISVPEENNITFFQVNSTSVPILELKSNGDILVKGRLAGNDEEVVAALKEWVNNWK